MPSKIQSGAQNTRPSTLGLGDLVENTAEAIHQIYSFPGTVLDTLMQSIFAKSARRASAVPHPFKTSFPLIPLNSTDKIEPQASEAEEDFSLGAASRILCWASGLDSKLCPALLEMGMKRFLLPEIECTTFTNTNTGDIAVSCELEQPASH